MSEIIEALFIFADILNMLVNLFLCYLFCISENGEYMTEQIILLNLSLLQNLVSLIAVLTTDVMYISDVSSVALKVELHQRSVS